MSTASASSIPTTVQGAVMVSDYEAEVVAFKGKGPRRIDLRRAAPFGWKAAVLLGVIALVDRADQTVLAGALDAIDKEFQISEFFNGVILSAPTIAALILVVFAGRWADTKNRRNLLALTIGIWALLSFGSAAAPTFAILFIIRVLLGVATPITIPSSSSLAGDLYTTTARTKAFTALRALEFFGLPLGLVIGGIVSDTYGWRAAFLVMGIPALVVAGLVLLIIREPKRGLADELSRMAEDLSIAQGRAKKNKKARKEIQPAPPSPVTPPPTAMATTPMAAQGGSTVTGPATRSVVAGTHNPGSFEVADPEAINVEHAMDTREQIGLRQRIVGILKIRSLRYIILGQMLLFLGFAGLFSTVTIYLQRVEELDAKAATSLTGPVGSVGLIAGAIIGAIIGDRVAKKNKAGRVTIGGICLALSAICVAGFVLAPALPLKIVLFIAINAFNITALSNIGACTADVLPASKRGSGFAIAQFLITIGSSLGALLVFTISQIVVSSLGQGDTPNSLRTGITYGIASLILPLTIGSLLIFRARASFNRDADAAQSETIIGPVNAAVV
ncbi:MAG TPA: hypothetical protein DHW34_02695 [Actinobacteria bacterium]|nr:hypothetical protein [Actinomycetota bacterium]